MDLAGFSSDAPVNTATYYPPPTEETSVKDAGQQDPFDMSGFAESFSRTRYHSSPGQIETTESSDDILGILAQPVETFAKPKSPSPKPELAPEQPAKEESSDDEASNERDKAIASIVEMGFTIGQATRALAQTPSRTDVEAAINSLVSRPSSSASARHERPHPANQRMEDFPQRHTPDPQSRPSSQPKGISQMAGEVGTSLLKGAGSLWKSGREKMNIFIQEWEGDMDPSVPKWMADQQRHSPQPRPRRDDFTEEARVLDGPRDEVRRPRADPLERGSSSRSHNDRINLRKQVEEEAEMGYRSSARRRVPNRQVPLTQDIPSRTRTPPTKEIDLFSSGENSRPGQSSKPTSQRPSPSETPRIRTPPKSQVRQVPPTSESALLSSHSSRQKGSEAFKLGDYPLALTHYTSALTHLPSSHPQRIIILSNRAITNLKLGDAKAAVIDCNDLLTEVGPSEGENETIDDIEGPKNLREIWAKGIVRKATALEMQEKYADALESWKMAVNAGFGGTQALDGKRRCENALGIKSISNVPSRTATPSQISRPASAKPGPGKLSMPVRPNVNKTNFQKQSSATEDLARANAAAAADEDERLRLYDSVDGKVNAWQTGKESNLRALLSSLDLILWPEAGWKKVNMSELVVVTRVKIIYMKAIAKVHPDKVCIQMFFYLTLDFIVG